MVAAVVTPIKRLRVCKAYTRCATLMSAGVGLPGISVFSDNVDQIRNGSGGSLPGSCACNSMDKIVAPVRLVNPS